jgi:hypothetical protein
MLSGMIKTKKDDGNEVVTRGWFRDAFREGIDELAMLINKSFIGMESRMAKQDDLLALAERVKAIEETVSGHDKEFMGIHDNFSVVFGELKSIRERLDRIEKNDLRPEVIDLDLRVRKLEKKARIQ